MKSRIKVFSRFKHPEGDMEKLAHHGTDNQFRGLARECETLLESLAPGGFVQGDHRGHVECFAHESMADLGQSGFGFDARAGFMLARVEPCESGGLPTVGKTAGVGIEGPQDGDGAFPQDGDAVEQFALPLQAGVGVDVSVDGLGQRLDLLVEPIQVFLDVGAHGIAGDTQAIAFLCSASRRNTSARKAISASLLACQGGGWRSAQKPAMRRASTASVLLRASRAEDTVRSSIEGERLLQKSTTRA